MRSWSLAIDIGTSFTTAVVAQDAWTGVLEIDDSRCLPSCVFADEDGNLLVGREAMERAADHPERAERAPKRALAARDDVWIADRAYPTTRLVAAILRTVADEAIRRQDGKAPSRVVLTHPAQWGERELRRLTDAARSAELPDVELVAEPLAAAQCYLAAEDVPYGRCVAVYDLGGGTLDVALLRRTRDGFALEGPPGGDAGFGGEDLDDVLLSVVATRATTIGPPAWEPSRVAGEPERSRRRARWRETITQAREELSARSSVTVHPEGYDEGIEVTRAAYERAIEPRLLAGVEELRATIERAGVSPGDLDAIYLAGNASRTPLVSELIHEGIGIQPRTMGDPKALVALGALAHPRIAAAASAPGEGEGPGSSEAASGESRSGRGDIPAEAPPLASRRLSPRGAAVLALVLVLLAGVGISLGLSDSGASGVGDCSAGTANLLLAASPDIAPAVSAALAAQPVRCGAVAVAPRSGAEVAGLLSGQTAAADALPRPDVWIPDTSMWVSVARSTPAGVNALQATTTSVATSPVVIALPTPVARGMNALSITPSWAGLLPSLQTSAPLQVEVPSPTTSGPGLSTLAAVTRTAENTPGVQGLAGLTQAVRTMATNTQPDAGTIIGELPKTEAATASGPGIGALTASEQAVWKYDNSSPSVPLSAIYPAEGAIPMDYPLVESSGLSPAQQHLATELLNVLTDSQSCAVLQANGFRAPHGIAGPAIAHTTQLKAARPAVAPVPTADQVRTLLGLWSAAIAPIRLLGAVDLSGSMNDQVPGANATRLELTQQALESGLALFPDASTVGLWSFTTQPTPPGATVPQTIMPLGPLLATVGPGPLTRRQALEAALPALHVSPGSRTGLYDTLVAAYKVVSQDWDPTKLNAVVIATDGLNPDLNNLSVQDTIAQLQQLSDPKKPIQVVLIAVGPGAKMGPLNQICAAIGGGSAAFNPQTSQDIQAVFFEGIAASLTARTAAQGR